MIKLQDFANQQGVTDRAIQKHLKTYAEELEGLYQRKGPNGTWLTDEACEILRSKMKQAPVTVFEASEQEEELRAQIRKLEQEKFEIQQRYTEYVTNTTQMLQTAAKQIYLAERSEENQKKADALEAQNAVLSCDKEKLKQTVKDKEIELKNASDELSRERTRPISLKEWWHRRKNKE